MVRFVGKRLRQSWKIWSRSAQTWRLNWRRRSQRRWLQKLLSHSIILLNDLESLEFRSLFLFGYYAMFFEYLSHFMKVTETLFFLALLVCILANQVTSMFQVALLFSSKLTSLFGWINLYLDLSLANAVCIHEPCKSSGGERDHGPWAIQSFHVSS